MALVSPPPDPPLTDQHKTPSKTPSKTPQNQQQQQQQQQQVSKSGVLSVRFNQDHGCFACCSQTGFVIFNCEPFRETFRREFGENSGIGLVEMLFRCNILAIVGGGEYPMFSPNKVMIWDDQQSRCIGELSFRSEVRGVKLRRDRVVVVMEHKVYVYNFSDLKLLQQIETIANPTGVAALSPASTPVVLACPGLHKGQVRVEHYGLKKTKFIAAHDSPLACMALTHDGRLLATASVKGTLVRIFSTIDGTQLQEVRRGADRAEIYSLAFSPTADWLVVSSDKGTIHVFSLKVPAAGEESRSVQQDIAAGGGGAGQSGSAVASLGGSPLRFGNPGSTLSFMRGVLPRYFSSEWSFAQFRLPDEARSVVAFGAQKHTVLIVSSEGSFYKCSFDPVNGGEMIQQEYAKFVQKEKE